MPTVKTDLEFRLFSALKNISQYDAPDKLRRISERDYGIDAEEAIEMAYENVIHEAKSAVKGIRGRKA